MKQVSRQREWQLEKQRIGLCTICAKPAEGGRRCPKCRRKVTLKQRERLGLEPWHPGGRGRPPLPSSITDR